MISDATNVQFGDGIKGKLARLTGQNMGNTTQQIRGGNSREIIIKGKKGNCRNLPLPFGTTTVSFAWGYDSFSEAEKAAGGYEDLFSLVDY